MGTSGRKIQNSGWPVQQKAEHLMECAVLAGLLIERVL